MHFKRCFMVVIVVLLMGCTTPQSTISPTATSPLQTPGRAVETSTSTVIQPITPLPITPTTITELSRQTLDQVPFTIYVPTGMSDQLHQTSAQIHHDGSRVLVEIQYQDTQEQEALFVLLGKEHCCLDAAGKAVNPITLASGETAYYLPNEPAYGGNILWWIHEGTYIALSGPQLTKEALMQVANTVQPMQTSS